MKYLHIRKRNKVGKPLPNGGITFAYEEKSGVVLAAYARCSENDIFSKRLGRQIAMNRHLQAFKDVMPTDFAFILPSFGRKAEECLARAAQKMIR